MKTPKPVKTKALPTNDPYTPCNVPDSFTGQLVGMYEAGSWDWRCARAERIGASEIGVICGWSPWQTRADLLATKNLTEPAQSKAMQRGHILEPAVAEWFRQETGVDYLSGSAGTYVHPDNDWALANPDRICNDGALLEIKTSSEKSTEHGWGRAGTDQVPLLYQAQAIWQMYVTGLRVCHFAVLFGQPFNFAKYVVRWDQAAADYLVKQGETFIRELRARNLTPLKEPTAA